MNNYFEEIRNRLDIKTVAEHYGIEISHNNTCLCPFHNDHHPSAHIYPNAFHCFTCNAHYDVIGFVMALFGLSAINAAKKLNKDFALGIYFGYKKEITPPRYNEEAEIREIRRRKRERFVQWENKSWHTIHDYLWHIRNWFEKYKPPIMNYVPQNYVYDKRFEYAILHYTHAEAFANEWICNFSDEEKVEHKWVIDKMQTFLNKYKDEESPQNPESPGTNQY